MQHACDGRRSHSQILLLQCWVLDPAFPSWQAPAAGHGNLLWTFSRYKLCSRRGSKFLVTIVKCHENSQLLPDALLHQRLGLLFIFFLCSRLHMMLPRATPCGRASQD